MLRQITKKDLIYMTNGRAIEEDIESRNLDEFKGNYI